jgi:hypothetical protein
MFWADMQLTVIIIIIRKGNVFDLEEIIFNTPTSSSIAINQSQKQVRETPSS